MDCGPEIPKDRQGLSEQFLGLPANVKFQPINLKDFFTVYPRTHYGQCPMVSPGAIKAIHAGFSLNALYETFEDRVVIFLPFITEGHWLKNDPICPRK